MVKNIKLTISYDGTNYHGWQKQNGIKTIQSELESVIHAITGEQVDLVASGRTDTNVHALGQIANFKTTSKILPEKFSRAINANISDDIRVLKSEEVDLEFNSRFSSKRKTYLYQIYNSRVLSPFFSLYSYHIPYDLDLELMDKALKRLEGEHDFKAFMASNSEVKSTIRTIYNTRIKRENNLIKIEITGNGFLYNMVRIIVGTVIEIGNQRKTISCIDEAMLTGERKLLGHTAKPQGLFLKNVEY